MFNGTKYFEVEHNFIFIVIVAHKENSKGQI